MFNQLYLVCILLYQRDENQKEVLCSFTVLNSVLQDVKVKTVYVVVNTPVAVFNTYPKTSLSLETIKPFNCQSYVCYFLIFARHFGGLLQIGRKTTAGCYRQCSYNPNSDHEIEKSDFEFMRMELITDKLRSKNVNTSISAIWPLDLVRS